MGVDLATATRRARFGKMMPPVVAKPVEILPQVPQPLPIVVEVQTAPIPERPIVCSICAQKIEAGVVTVGKIQRIVAHHYNIGMNEMCSSIRQQYVVRARHLAMYLARKMTTRSMPEIGRYFGGRDHTTVLNAVRKFDHLTRTDQKVAAEVEAVKSTIV